VTGAEHVTLGQLAMHRSDSEGTTLAWSTQNEAESTWHVACMPLAEGRALPLAGSASSGVPRATRRHIQLLSVTAAPLKPYLYPEPKP